MAIFFFILGICILAFSLFCFIYLAWCDYYDEERWVMLGLIALFIGIVVTAGGACFAFADDTHTPKQEETLRTETTDSLGMIIEKDTVYSIKFIIYSNEGNRINVGNGIVLEGYTNKSIGDTITVNLR